MRQLGLGLGVRGRGGGVSSPPPLFPWLKYENCEGKS
jgi:hypothetical protein